MINYLIQKIRLLTVNRKEPYLLLSGYNVFPRNIQYYDVAFSHKSASNKVNGKVVNNERLEYLGDGVLDAVVADILYHKYPNRKEGFLTNTRSKLVKRETLNKLALDMGLNNFISIQNKKLTHNINIYGNAFEALVGAVFLDLGYDKSRDFMQAVIDKHIDWNKFLCEEQNFKSRLLEWCQKYKTQYEFKLLEASEDGENNPIFKSMVLVNGVPAGVGVGYTKRESEQKAAQKALSRVRSNKVRFLNADVVDDNVNEDGSIAYPPPGIPKKKFS